MIRNFRHNGLERYFAKSDRNGIDARQADRIRRILDRLDAAAAPGDMDLPGYRFHSRKGDRKGSYAAPVSGNRRITFRFERGDATDVNLEDYH